MSLKRSETNNYSWIINAILDISFLLLLLLPNMLSIDCEINKEFLKIDSENFILQKWTAPSSSRCTCWEWRRRWITFIKTSYASRVIPWFNINPFINRNVLGEEPANSLLCGFAFSFDRYAKSYTSSCNAGSSGWSSGTSVSLLFESITNLIHAKFFTRSACCLRSETRFWSELHEHHARNWSWLPARVQFFVFLDPSSSLWWSIFSWKSVFTTDHCMKLFSSVLVMKYCSISTTLRNTTFIQNLLTLSVCESPWFHWAQWVVT